MLAKPCLSSRSPQGIIISLAYPGSPPFSRRSTYIYTTKKRIRRKPTHLRYMRPLFPTFATANWRPSRPAEPPSGAMSNLSSSWLPFLIRHEGISSWDLRSDTGRSVLGNKLGDVRDLSFLLRTPPGPATVEGLSPSRPRVGGDRR